MKFKIIILVFIVIALLYAVHFVLTQLDKGKKKETFVIDDDVEHYEDPVVTSPKPKADAKEDTKSETKYDTRVLILNDIEKMDINNKEIKGQLMEYLFASDVIAKISSMANNERSIFIQSKYDLLKTGVKLDSTSSETTTKVSSVAEHTPEKKPEHKSENKSEFNSNTDSKPASIVPPKPNKVSSDIYDGLSVSNRELLSKTEEALEGIFKVQSNIQQIQDNIKSKAIYIDKLPEGYREPDIPDPDKLKEKLEKNVIEGFQDKISGFENVRNYASLF